MNLYLKFLNNTFNNLLYFFIYFSGEPYALKDARTVREKVIY